MERVTVVLATICMCIAAAAQTNDTSSQTSQHSGKSKDEITVSGCLGRSNTDYILTQADKGNSYQLTRSRKLKLGPYLGQEVEVTGAEYPSLSTSSDYLARSGSASPVTIRVTAIKTIAKTCSGS